MYSQSVSLESSSVSTLFSNLWMEVIYCFSAACLCQSLKHEKPTKIPHEKLLPLMLFICVSEMQWTHKINQIRLWSLISILSGGVISWIWPDSYLHHQLPGCENHFWALWAGPEDLPEPQGEVPGEEHCPGLWVREGTGGAVQTSGRAALFTSGVHWRTLPRGESLLPTSICQIPTITVSNQQSSS